MLTFLCRDPDRPVHVLSNAVILESPLRPAFLQRPYALIYDRFKAFLSVLKRHKRTLDPWNALGDGRGRRSKERGWDGQDHGTKTLASLYLI